MTDRKYSKSAWKLVSAAAILALLVGPTAAWACSTPVYSYAMSNWAPAPFGVFYLYRDKPAERDNQINLRLAELAEEGPARTNMIFQAINVDKKEQLDRLNEFVLKTWRSHDDGKTPLHLVLAPWGGKLFAGRLEKATLEAMIGSPARSRAAELLGAGNAAVLLLLECADAKANQQAAKVIDQVIAKAASGAIQGVADLGGAGPAAFLPPDAKKTQANGDDELSEPTSNFKLTTLRVSRTDKAEKWLVDQLMRVEPDLHEYAKEPMVFALFGRGRALEPYIGKGITVDNLIECASFLGGACSCMVKEQNPGADLLMRWDWDATAEAMPMPGGPPANEQLVYQEFVPGEMTADGSPGQKEPTTEPSSPTKKKPATKPSTPTADTSKPSGQPPTSKLDLANTGDTLESGSSFVSGQAWKFAIGFVVATVLVLGLGFVILWRR